MLIDAILPSPTARVAKRPMSHNGTQRSQSTSRLSIPTISFRLGKFFNYITSTQEFMIRSNQGSICTDCAKIFQNPPTPLTGMPAPVPKEPSPAQAAPSAQPSPSAGAARRRRRRRPTAITKGQILQLRRASEKRRSGVLKKSGQLRHTGTQIRGRWTSPGVHELLSVYHNMLIL